jgi:hypothetical protein
VCTRRTTPHARPQPLPVSARISHIAITARRRRERY